MEIGKKYGYVRVSSKSQESNSSIQSQKDQLIQNAIQPENIRIEVQPMKLKTDLSFKNYWKKN